MNSSILQDKFWGHQELELGRWCSIPIRRKKWVTQEIEAAWAPRPAGRRRRDTDRRGSRAKADLVGSFTRNQVFPNLTLKLPEEEHGTWPSGARNNSTSFLNVHCVLGTTHKYSVSCDCPMVLGARWEGRTLHSERAWPAGGVATPTTAEVGRAE